jgi:hypothetical protein
MTTQMSRLQISLPRLQREYLDAQAQRAGVSVAEIVRRLVEREQQADVTPASTPDSIWNIVGIGTDESPLINNIPVSADPDLYLYGPRRKAPRSRRKKHA